MPRFTAEGPLHGGSTTARRLPALPTFSRFSGPAGSPPSLTPIYQSPDRVARHYRNEAIIGLLELATENSRTVTEATRAAERAEKSYLTFLAALRLYCLGPTHQSIAEPVRGSVQLDALSQQVPGWTSILAGLPSAGWDAPQKARGESGAVHAARVASSANERIADLSGAASRVHTFANDHYRTLPWQPVIEPLRGWFKWSLRDKILAVSKLMDSYLVELGAFLEPPLLTDTDDFATTAAALIERQSMLSEPLRVWAGPHAALLTAAGDRVTKPGVLGPSLDTSIEQAAQGARQLDRTVRELLHSGQV